MELSGNDKNQILQEFNKLLAARKKLESQITTKQEKLKQEEDRKKTAKAGS